MATTRKGGRYVLAAGASLTALQYTFVKQSAQTVVGATAATDKLLGILQNAPASGDSAEVIGRHSSETSKLKIGSGGCSIGDKLTSDSAGKGVVTTTGADQVGAIALADASANDIIEVTPVYSIVR